MLRRVLYCSNLVLGVSLLVYALTSQQHVEPAQDPFMGDWQGTLTSAAGDEQPLCAQVICWGEGNYQANLLPAFDQRVAALAVLQGKREGDTVRFGEQASLTEESFTGTLAKPAGRFALKPVTRLSPTLGAKPPAGAVVLFDGASLDDWQSGGTAAFALDLGKVVGGENRAAYLRTVVTSPAAQPVRLEVGSDDGVKVWLDGALVHSKNASRGLTPWEDKIDLDLHAGANVMLLKVCQGAGGWAACARFLTRDGKPVEGLQFDPAPRLPAEQLLEVQQGCPSTVVTWQLAGPYSQAGKVGPTALFDVPFAPETDAAVVKWRTVNEKPDPPKHWELVDGGAVQVTPGAGSSTTKRAFRDFHLHLEFRTPFMPTARGQGRGNSGVYLQGRYEIQVLDSYGLEGKDNECGGIYKKSQPLVNMCAPPLQWQSYDVDFTAPRYDEEAKKMAPGSVTVRHNGVLIQDGVKLDPGSAGGPGYVQEGPILLQDHGNPVRYRNIWVVEK